MINETQGHPAFVLPACKPCDAGLVELYAVPELFLDELYAFPELFWLSYTLSQSCSCISCSLYVFFSFVFSLFFQNFWFVYPFFDSTSFRRIFSFMTKEKSITKAWRGVHSRKGHNLFASPKRKSIFVGSVFQRNCRKS